MRGEGGAAAVGERQASSDNGLCTVTCRLGQALELERDRSGVRTSWDTVFRSVEMAVAWGREHMNLDGIEAIGIDEIQLQRGHKYLTLVYQIDEHRRRLPWVGEHRKVKTALGFFRWFGKERSAALRFVCSDMWRPYRPVSA